ncbi:hypothetical protein CBR_g70708 [Chara braunii]|uniref:Uncharacterized protein n=1 Tax=Chara braunii TaxID=69332 RepID=A0A388K9W0_CHABU|nr:hypothetical protein CBR_g70708 [Chara braunii]|eukprot:GBG66830.1 hypothetical protein CBR_g70708 [Chara braunii]
MGPQLYCLILFVVFSKQRRGRPLAPREAKQTSSLDDRQFHIPFRIFSTLICALVALKCSRVPQEIMTHSRFTCPPSGPFADADAQN